MSNLHKIVILFCLFLVKYSHAQLDNEFWFVAPAVTENHSASSGCSCTQNNRCGASPASFNFTNTNAEDAVVEITQPANAYDFITNPTGFKPITLTVPANSFLTHTLWTQDICDVDEAAMRKLFENRHDKYNPTGPLDKGIRIVSTENITVYYEVEEKNNSDIFALKGENALGSLFFVPFQTNKHNHDFGTAGQQQARSAIDIVAVDKGVTRIWVYPTNPVVGWGQPDSFLVELTYGQTINLVPGVDNGGGSITYNRDGADHLHGTKIRVEGGKRVAVTISDDSVHGDSGCYDLLGDQTVPVVAVDESGNENEIIGTDYIIMKGSLGWDKSGTADRDRVYILATEDNTNVTVSDLTKGTSQTFSNMQSQQQEKYTINYEDFGSSIIHVKGDKPIYALHVTGAGGGCELGQSVIPTISQCTGSFDVGFSRGAYSSSKAFFLNLMVLGDTLDPHIDSARYYFSFARPEPNNGSATDSSVIIPKPEWGDQFVHVTGTNWYTMQLDFTDTIFEHSRYIISNSRNLFHLGTLNGGKSNGGNFGYFSNYSRIKANSNVSGMIQVTGNKLCYGESIQLEARGGLNYEWFPSTFLNDSSLQRPTSTPFADIKYGVRVTGASCSLADTAYINLLVSNPVEADYSLEKYHGCGPFVIKPENNSIGNQVNEWYINNQYMTGKAEPDSFVLRNTTDTIVDYDLKLIVWNLYCPKRVERKVRVFPEIHAGFEADTNAGCQPLQIAFTDTSTGGVDSASYTWDFNDLNYSNKQHPVHSFENALLNDQVYNVKMLLTSRYLCEDSAFLPITVHPRIYSELAIDTAISCSPMYTGLDPLNSVGVDTFFYYVNYPATGDTLYKRTDETPTYLSYTDQSHNTPDTVKIDLVVMNRMGCTDTLEQKKIIVYPEVIAAFEADTNAICDSLTINYINSSTGYNLNYQWSFGDGNTSADSTGKAYTQRYYNRSSADKQYFVHLKAVSDYFCFDNYYDTITVHPYVNPLFSLDYNGQCTPLPVTIKNNTTGVNTTDIVYNLNWGDGSVILTNQPDIDNFVHVFSNPDPQKDTTYTVTLTATHNVGGCYDSIKQDISLYPLVAANFTIPDSAGCHPHEVTFNNTSQGRNLVYNWDFGNGDGNDTSVVSFKKIFNNYTSSDKTFDVNLYVTNSDGCDSAITKQVAVYAFIDALFGVQTTDSCSPFPVRVQNYSPNGVTNVEWDFNDGSSLRTETEPMHTYHNTSDTTVQRNIRLVVSNNHPQCTDTAFRSVNIYPEIRARFQADIYEGCQPLAVTINNTSNIINNTDFTWGFGDTNFYYGATPPSYTYSNPSSVLRNRTVTLRAVTEHYCYDDTSIVFDIYPFIEARFGIDQAEICSGDSFLLDAQASRGFITNYNWNTNDGITIDKPGNAPFGYSYDNENALSENKNIRLITSNTYNCSDTAFENIMVRPKIHAGFTASPQEACYPFTTNFTNTTAQGNHRATIFNWSLGDGATSTSNSLTFDHFYKNLSFTTDSVFPVKLVAKSIYNCSDSAFTTITVHPKPKASFTLDNAISCPPFDPGVNNESSGTNLSYQWTFPGGTPGTNTQNEPAVLYQNLSNSISTSNIQLISETEFGCLDTIVKKLRVYPSVKTYIVADKTSDCHPLFVDFTGSESTNAYDFEWTNDGVTFSIEEAPTAARFGNGTTNQKTMEIVFRGESAYGCEDSDTIQVSIYPSPIVDFVPDPLSQNYGTEDDETTFTFKNITNARENWSYQWNFDDGNTSSSNESTVSHTYGYEFWGDINDDNKLYVHLYAENPDFPACFDSVTHWIALNPPKPQINIGDAVEVCGGITIPLQATYRYVNENQFYWDFGDGRTSNAPDPGSITYDEAGKYVIRLEVNGDGGSSWDFKEVTIHQNPKVNFTLLPDIATSTGNLNNLPDTIYFKNLTRYATDYQWTFTGDYLFSGDVILTDTSRNPKHVFYKEYLDDEEIDSTNYAVKLVATNYVSDLIQCKDSVLRENAFKVVGAGKLNMPNALQLSAGSGDPGSYEANVFRPVTEDVTEYQLEIYDRWGTLLYKTSEILPDGPAGWNGTIERTGELVKAGVYVYKVKATFINGRSKTDTGDITVIYDNVY